MDEIFIDEMAGDGEARISSGYLRTEREKEYFLNHRELIENMARTKLGDYGVKYDDARRAVASLYKEDPSKVFLSGVKEVPSGEDKNGTEIPFLHYWRYSNSRLVRGFVPLSDLALWDEEK